MRSAKLTGERKPVTALFADVVGSTTLAESMDPEDWTQIVNEAFDLMSQAASYLLFGEGETGLIVYTILLRYWDWTPEDDVRPLIFLMSD